MKAGDIKLNGLYKAKVNGVVVVVKVLEIDGLSQFPYRVLNTKTNRETRFRSAAKFREPVDTNDALVAAAGKLVGKVTATTPPARTAVPPEAARATQVPTRTTAVTATTPSSVSPPAAPATKPVSAFAQAMRNKGQVGPVDTSPHVIVKALAGTGKTTTCIEGIRSMLGLPTRIQPSPQQAAIWEVLAQSRGKASTIGMVAFNKAIADELKTKVPPGVEAMTAHSLGRKAVTAACKLLPGEKAINKWRVEDIVADLLGKDGRTLKREQPLLQAAVSNMVGLCKMNLVGLGWDVTDERWKDELDAIASHYEVELVSEDGRHNVKEAVYDLVPRVLDRCLDVARDGCIDFNDMVWLPVALNLPITCYDVLFVDECQDLNRCTQELVCRSGKRVVFVGDEHQAIYGFAGADAESMQRLEARLTDSERGCVVLPLTMTRRCGRAIVAEACAIVPGFEAAPTNGEGLVYRRSYRGVTRGTNPPTTHRAEEECYRTLASNGDMVLCRINAPLVSECFKFIKEGKRANIAGRDIGKGLKTLVTKMCYGNPSMPVPELIKALEQWSAEETAKEQARKRPSESKLIAIDDKFTCLVCFTEGSRTAGDVLAKIDSIFTDDRNTGGILLSSIHKSKGLEAKRVFLLEPERGTVPHPMARSKWQITQEWNLRYVAITRAIEELVYVKEEPSWQGDGGRYQQS